jgi:hypothetical protein
VKEVTHWFLEKSKHPDRLQEIVQIIVKCGRWIYAVNVGVQFLRIGFYERRFLKLGVYVEITESKPEVERQSGENEHYRKRPKVELFIVLR